MPELGLGGVEQPERPFEVTGRHGLLRARDLVARQLAADQPLALLDETSLVQGVSSILLGPPCFEP